MAKLPAAALDYFRAEGKRGGHTAASNMSAEQRAARASKGGRALAKARKAAKKKAAKA